MNLTAVGGIGGGGLGALAGQVGQTLSAPRRALWQALGLPEHGNELVAQMLGLDPDSLGAQGLGMGAEMAGDPLSYAGALSGALGGGRVGQTLARGAQVRQAASAASEEATGAAAVLARQATGFQPSEAEILGGYGAPAAIPGGTGRMPAGIDSNMPIWEPPPPVAAPEQEPLLSGPGPTGPGWPANTPPPEVAGPFNPRDAHIPQHPMPPALAILGDATQDAMGGLGARLSDRHLVSELVRELSTGPGSGIGQHLGQQHYAGLRTAQEMADAENLVRSTSINSLESRALGTPERQLLDRAQDQASGTWTSSRLPRSAGGLADALDLDRIPPAPQSYWNAAETGAGSSIEPSENAQAILRGNRFDLRNDSISPQDRLSGRSALAEHVAPVLAEARRSEPALANAMGLREGLEALMHGTISPQEAQAVIARAQAYGLPIDPKEAMDTYWLAMTGNTSQMGDVYLQDMSGGGPFEFGGPNGHRLAPAAEIGAGGNMPDYLQGMGSRLEAERTQHMGGLLRALGADNLNWVAHQPDTRRSLEELLRRMGAPQQFRGAGPETGMEDIHWPPY